MTCGNTAGGNGEKSRIDGVECRREKRFWKYFQTYVTD